MTAVMRSRVRSDRIRYGSAMRMLAALAREHQVAFEVPRDEVRRRITQDRQAPHRAAHGVLRDWQEGVWSP